MFARREFASFFLILTLTSISGFAAAVQPSGPKPPRAIQLPTVFEENRGQTDSHALFVSGNANQAVFLERNEIRILNRSNGAGDGIGGSLLKEPNRSDHSSLLNFDLRMRNANVRPGITGEQPSGIFNYLIGNNREEWHTGVPTFRQVRYSEIYPGIDLVLYESGGHLEFDFEVKPAGDPSRIAFELNNGRQHAQIDANGDLVLGSLTVEKPVLYQLDDKGRRQIIKGAFRLDGDGAIRFNTESFDHHKPLVIDPVINYSTYFGPSAYTEAFAMDAAGNSFIAGITASLSTSGGNFTAPKSYSPNEFVCELSADGTQLTYCTFIGGSKYGEVQAIAVDSADHVYLTGHTLSTDYPVTAGAFQTSTKASEQSSFVTSLDATGKMVFSTYLAGNDWSEGFGIAVDSSGGVYAAGYTRDTDFPTTATAFAPVAAKKAPLATNYGWVTKLNATGTALVYSTFLEGTGDDYINALTVDSQGDAYVVGTTNSKDFPTTTGAFQHSYNSLYGTGFVSKIKPDGTGLSYSTFVGGTHQDTVNAITLDAAGEAYVTGESYSPDFPSTPGVFQPTLNHYAANAFIGELNASGSGLIYATLLGGELTAEGGTTSDAGVAIAIDSAGNAIVGGTTYATDFPVTPGAFQTVNLSSLISGSVGSFVAIVNPGGTKLLYSTYLSGSGNQTGEDAYDMITGLALDGAGNVHVAGMTASIDFPLTPGKLYTPYSESTYETTFLTVFNRQQMHALPLTTVNLSSSANPQISGVPTTYTAQVAPTSGTTPTGLVAFNFEDVEYSDQADSFGMGPWIVAPVDSTGTATLTISRWVPLPIEVDARYLGDDNNAPSSSSITETLTPVPTTITLIASPNPVLYGNPITLTANVRDSMGFPIVGDISFPGARVPVDSSGSAQYTLTNPSPQYPGVGTSALTATFEPNVDTGMVENSTSVQETVQPLGVTPAPTFTPAPGSYTSAQSVQIAETLNQAAIYYTTDGSTPTQSISEQYFPGSPTRFINVTSTTTIKAIAITSGYTVSDVATATYTIVPPPDFALSLQPTSLQLEPGTQSSTTVSVTYSNGLYQAVSLACSGLPAGLSCSFAPSNLTNTGNSTLTISASASANAQHRPGGGPFPVLACVFLAGIAGFRRRRSLLVLIFGLVVLGVSSCGGGASNNAGGRSQNPEVYSISVVGTAGTLTHSSQLTVTLE